MDGDGCTRHVTDLLVGFHWSEVEFAEQVAKGVHPLHREALVPDHLAKSVFQVLTTGKVAWREYADSILSQWKDFVSRDAAE